MRGRRLCRRPRDRSGNLSPADEPHAVRRSRDRRRPGRASPPRPRRRSAGLRVALVDERPTLGGQIFKQPGPGFRVTTARALGRDFVRGRPLIDGAERSGAAAAAPHERRRDRAARASCSSTEGEHARERSRRGGCCSPPGRTTGRSSFPGWTLPGVHHRRRRADARQDPARAARAAHRLRRQRPARARVPRAAPRLRRERRRSCSRPGRRPGPRDVVRLARGRPRQREASPRRAALPRRLLRGSRAAALPPHRRARRGRRAASSGSSTPQSTPPGGSVAGTEETVAADTLCVGYGFVPSVELLRLAGCDFALRRGSRRAGGRASTSGCARRVAGHLGRRRRHRRRGLVRRRRRGPARRARGRSRPRRDHRRRGRSTRRRRSARGCAARRRFAGRCARCTRSARESTSSPRRDTVVCRCEEVTRARRSTGRSRRSADLNVVKGFTRAGMGLCQGRNCQRQIAAMIARRHGGRSPMSRSRRRALPVRPVPIGAVADASIEDGGFFTPMTDAHHPGPAGSAPGRRLAHGPAAREHRRPRRRRRPRRDGACLLPRAARASRSCSSSAASSTARRPARTPAAFTSRSRSIS